MALSLVRRATSLRSTLLNSGTLLVSKKKCEVIDSISASAYKKRINVLSEQFIATHLLTVMF